MPTKVIVSTSIYPVSEALTLYDKLPDWTLVVIGDQKTPKDFSLKRGVYVGPQEQERKFPKLSELIGWNSIQRRNLGFLIAAEMKADLIATVDDDNIPYAQWGQRVLAGTTQTLTEYQSASPVFDPIGATEYRHLWHRGFPLQLLSQRNYQTHTSRSVQVAIQANFWDGDPDVDAICRMEHQPRCTFRSEGFPFTSQQMSPFNSQNTIVTGDVLPHYFMIPGVGRMDDIWASYYVQALGFRVAYDVATVRQDRNDHDLTKDMRGEFIGYEKSLELVQALKNDPRALTRFIPEKATAAFREYQKHFGKLETAL